METTTSIAAVISPNTPPTPNSRRKKATPMIAMPTRSPDDGI